ncbi:tRNA modification GTPase-like protein mss1 [Calycina marina]|uniref:tRNA modification GTPase-like protein mss1 n=1 Tax=Calycina marina TaxID=1763456 RepID=A0A9P8CI40_9HELO|nr:tRNA modification GTPase-like protein mss1 [Calycina marina]
MAYRIPLKAPTYVKCCRELPRILLTASLATINRKCKGVCRLTFRQAPHTLVPRSQFHTLNSRYEGAENDETIYAVSTGAGRAGIAIIRISGPACLEIYNSFCPGLRPPKPQYACLRTLYDPIIPSEILDSDALILHFTAPKTVTGEDVLELHIHGGPATVKAVLSAIPRCPSKSIIRYAEPGEFTRRAFENDRLDLAQVEALSDTLSAETEQQRRAAVRGNSGKLGRTYEAWRQQLLYARGELEALIDFSEDQHFDESPAELLGSVAIQVHTMLESIKTHQKASQRGELLRRGIRISLIGPPNAGKSSLLNQIVGREASIVSPEAGTTRDIVEVSLDIRGYLCTFADTAGLRGDPHLERKMSGGKKHVIGNIEKEGIRRAKAKAQDSDVIVSLAYTESALQAADMKNSIAPAGRIISDPTACAIAADAPYSLTVVNKFDAEKYGSDPSVVKCDADSVLLDPIYISCKDAQYNVKSDFDDPGNIKFLIEKLVGIFEKMTTLPVDIEDLLGVTARQRELLMSCSEHLQLFITESRRNDDDCDIVLAAEHLRSAANCISRITGRGEAGDVEEVLGVVFEKYDLSYELVDYY